MPANYTEIEKHLWKAVDELRANSKLQLSEYLVPVLGLIFLLYADYKFALVKQELAAGGSSRRRTVGKTDYQAKGALFLPDEARFDYLLNLPEAEDIGGAINGAMKALADENEELGGALPRDYNRLEKPILHELLKILNRIPRADINEDAFGEIYQYFLRNFAQKEGQKGGESFEFFEFFTPTSLVKLIVEVIEPDYGMILDPACGTGGMFVQSAVRIRNKLNQDPNKVISVYGQEKVDARVKLCQMNLAVHGVSGLRNIRQGNTYYEDIHHSVGQFDIVMGNPPFNVNGVDREKLKSDPHYAFGVPSTDNANYLWIQLFYSALNQNGRAGFVMANSASDARGSELEIRRQLIQKGAVDVMIAIGSNFFYTMTLPCTLWFLDRRKVKTPRKEKVLFIDARHIYCQVDRAHRDFSEEQVEFIANIVRLYRGEAVEVTGAESEMLAETFPERAYRDVAGLCKVATLAEIEAQGWSLNPGRYVGSLDYVDINPPAGFKAIQLGDIADLSTGINLARDGKSTNNSASRKAYLLTAQNIQSDGSLNLDTARRIDIAAITDTGQEEKVNKLLLKPNDILLARIGTKGNHKVAIVPDDLTELVTYADSLIRVRVKPNLATAKNVFAFLQSDSGQISLQKFVSGVSIQRISVQNLAQILVFLPEKKVESQANVDELSVSARAVRQIKDYILPLLEEIENSGIEKSLNDQESEVEDSGTQKSLNECNLEIVASKLRHLASTLAPAPLPERVMSHYPTPIALAYRRFYDSRFNIYEQTLRLRDLFESASFFVYNLVLSDVLRRLNPKQFYIEDAGARRAYNGYSMSKRIDFVEEVIKIANKNRGRDLFIPELVDSSVLSRAKQLVDWRNQLSHTATLTESKQRKAFDDSYSIVEEMLVELEFLADYQLTRIPSFYCKQGQLICRMEVYTGAVPNLTEQSISLDTQLTQAEHNHLILLDREYQILDLYPLYQLIDNEQTQYETHLCFFKQCKKKDQILEGESVHNFASIQLTGFDDFSNLQNIILDKK